MEKVFYYLFLYLQYKVLWVSKEDQCQLSQHLFQVTKLKSSTQISFDFWFFTFVFNTETHSSVTQWIMFSYAMTYFSTLSDTLRQTLSYFLFLTCFLIVLLGFELAFTSETGGLINVFSKNFVQRCIKIRASHLKAFWC